MDRKLVLDRAKDLAVDVLRISQELDNRKQMVLSSQLLRAGTAIGALVAEAQQAETRADFIHKMKLACKEVEETDYWLSVVNHVVRIEIKVLEDLQVIKRILNKIVSTAKKNQKLEKGMKRYGDKDQ